MAHTVLYPKMAGVKAAAAQFNVTPTFIRKLCKEGKVRYTVISKTRWLVNVDSLASFFNTGEPIPAAEPNTVNGIRRVAE